MGVLWSQYFSIEKADEADISHGESIPLDVGTSLELRSELASKISAADFEDPDKNSLTIQRLEEDIELGATFKQLIEEYPEAIAPILSRYALLKIGEFYSKDSDVLHAFNGKPMLTHGHSLARNPDFENSWKTIIKRTARHGQHLRKNQWHDYVKIAAYVANIKNAGAPLGQGMIKPLLQKERKRAAGDSVWDYPLVQAVVEYKWRFWAKFYMRIQLSLYLCWLISFVCFVLAYTQLDQEERDFREIQVGSSFRTVATFFCDACAFIFMIPSFSIVLLSFQHNGLRASGVRSGIDALAVILQAIITIVHFTGIRFADDSYNILLAVHCVMLFLKSLDFIRCTEAGAAYLECLKSFVYNARIFLFFTVITLLAAALAFTVLYREDIEENRKQVDPDADGETFENFATIWKALVTTYEVFIGGFELEYVFETKSNKVFKAIFFLTFHLFLLFTSLNLLVSVIGSTYTDVMKRKRIILTRSRAQFIDSVEVIMPPTRIPRWKAYVHFIVIEKSTQQDYRLEALENDEVGSQISFSEVTTRLESLENKMRNLDFKFDAMFTQVMKQANESEELLTEASI